MTDTLSARQRAEHEAKYQALADWLGESAVRALVPFSPEQVRDALRVGDVHLNTLPLPAWDRQHGYHPDDNAGRGFGLAVGVGKTCPTCGHVSAAPDRKAGVWGLVRAAIDRDRRHGDTPLIRAWSLSDTTCVLKHVARTTALAQYPELAERPE